MAYFQSNIHLVNSRMSLESTWTSKYDITSSTQEEEFIAFHSETNYDKLKVKKAKDTDLMYKSRNYIQKNQISNFRKMPHWLIKPADHSSAFAEASAKAGKLECLAKTCELAEMTGLKKILDFKIKPKKKRKMREGDWLCTKCENLNFCFRTECNVCQLRKSFEN